MPVAVHSSCRHTSTSQSPRAALVESYTLGGQADSSLRIDEENGIIFGVKLGGRFSPNCHGIRGVTEGTEYKASAYKEALALYEGAKVFIKHSRGQSARDDRDPFEYMGVIRNARYDDASDCPRGDFHYKKTHPRTPELLEDIKRGMGGFGFSHHIPPGGYTGRVVNGKLIVEKINEIKSVDLVNDPATTRNLWEARSVSTTFKAILESRLPKLSSARRSHANRLLEDDSMPGDVMDAPVEEPSTDPDQALKDGFRAAILAVLDDDSMDVNAKKKKIGELLATEEKLTGDEEPPAATEEDEGDEGDGEPDESAKESKEVRKLRAENACLKAGVEAKPALVKALALLESEDDRRALIEATKAGATKTGGGGKAKSSGPGRSIQESNQGSSKVPEGSKFSASIRG